MKNDSPAQNTSGDTQQNVSDSEKIILPREYLVTAPENSTVATPKPIASDDNLVQLVVDKPRRKTRKQYIDRSISSTYLSPIEAQSSTLHKISIITLAITCLGFIGFLLLLAQARHEVDPCAYIQSAGQRLATTAPQGYSVAKKTYWCKQSSIIARRLSNDTYETFQSSIRFVSSTDMRDQQQIQDSFASYIHSHIDKDAVQFNFDDDSSLYASSVNRLRTVTVDVVLTTDREHAHKVQNQATDKLANELPPPPINSLRSQEYADEFSHNYNFTYVPDGFVHDEPHKTLHTYDLWYPGSSDVIRAYGSKSTSVVYLFVIETGADLSASNTLPGSACIKPNPNASCVKVATLDNGMTLYHTYTERQDGIYKHTFTEALKDSESVYIAKNNSLTLIVSAMPCAELTECSGQQSTPNDTEMIKLINGIQKSP